MAPTLRSIVLLSAALSADAFVARPNSAMTRARTAPQMGLGGLFKTKSAEVASAPDLSKTPITEAEVEQLQANWANAIKTCSKIYLEGGDYVGAAAKAAYRAAIEARQKAAQASQPKADKKKKEKKVRPQCHLRGRRDGVFMRPRRLDDAAVRESTRDGVGPRAG